MRKPFSPESRSIRDYTASVDAGLRARASASEARNLAAVWPTQPARAKSSGLLTTMVVSSRKAARAVPQARDLLFWVL